MERLDWTEKMEITAELDVTGSKPVVDISIYREFSPYFR